QGAGGIEGVFFTARGGVLRGEHCSSTIQRFRFRRTRFHWRRARTRFSCDNKGRNYFANPVDKKIRGKFCAHSKFLFTHFRLLLASAPLRMKKIEAIIKPFKLEDVKEALAALG